MNVDKNGTVRQRGRKWYSKRDTEAIYKADGRVILKLAPARKRKVKHP